MAINLGFTVNGRSINAYRIGSGDKKILFFGGIHGNEVGTVKLAYRLGNFLERQKKWHNDFSFFIIPCLNLDGYAVALQKPDYWHGGRYGRFNNNNVDLNRNFPTQSFQTDSAWLFGHNYSESIKVFCGESPGSEPEIQALTQFILKEKIEIIFAFHNAGKDLASTYDTFSEKIKDIFRKQTGFRSFSEEEWRSLKQTGTAKEWCEEHHIHFLEIEGSTRFGSDWAKQKKAFTAIIEFLNQN